MQHISHLTKNSLFTVNKYFLAVLVIFIVPISGLTTDIFVPSLPAIKTFFATQQNITQLTITAYMLGLGIMQLFAGSISDSFGRKKPFAIAMTLFILCTLWIPLSHSIHEVIALRFAQGVLVAMIVVPMRAVMSDLFEGKKFNKMASYMVFGWSIGPVIAPFIGGYLQHYFGWQANFHFLLAYSALAFVLILLFMPETSTYRHEFKISPIIKNYKTIITNKAFLASLLTNGFLFAVIILFISIAPFLTKHLLHFSAIQYGHLALVTGIAWAAGTIINRFLINMSIELKNKICVSAMVLISILFLLSTLLLPLTVYSLLIPIFLLYIFGGLLITAHFTRALSLFPKTAASANSLFGAFIYLIPAAISGIGTYLKATTATPLAAAIVVLILGILASQILLRQRKKLK